MKTPGSRIRRRNTARSRNLRKPGFFAAGMLLVGLAFFLPANAGRQNPAPPATGPQASGNVKVLFEPMPNFDVTDKQDLTLDFYVFGYLEGTPRIEGHRTSTSYQLRHGNPMPGALGICRKFIENVRQAGGEILYDNNRNIVTAKVTQGGRETWAEIACDNDRYRTNIVERQGAGKTQSGTAPSQSNATDAKVRDAVKANADKAFDELSAEEAKHTKVAAPPAGGKSQINDGKTDRRTVTIKEAGAAPPAKGTGSQPGTIATPAGATDLKQQSQGSKKPKPPSQPASHGGDELPKESISFNIMQASGSVVPCSDKPTLVRRGYTRGCDASAPDKRLCDQIAGQKLRLVNTSEWSCHSKDGALVKGALVSDRPLP